MINGDTEMAVTKLDLVPRYGENARICLSYERKRSAIDIAPDAGYKLEQCTPIYADLPTWSEVISDTRDFEDLPKEAQHYVEFIEQQTGVPITTIGVGPDREQVIKRPKPV